MFYTLLGSMAMCFGSLQPMSAGIDARSEQLKADIQACTMIAEREGIVDSADKTYVIEDLDGHEFLVKAGTDSGFVIYDPVSDQYLEKSNEMGSPFDFDKKAEYYYLGPMNYFAKTGDKYYSIFDEQYVDDKYIDALQDIFTEQLKRIRANTVPLSNNAPATTLSTKTYIQNYEFVKDAVHPSNWDGSCGFVAASIVLNYWHNTMYDQTILPQFLDSNGNLINTDSTYNPNINLKDKLVEFNGGKTDSWAYTVKKSLLKYAEWAGLSCNVGYYLFDINAYTEIANNRPVILFGMLPNDQKSEENPAQNIAHAVVAYGIEEGNYIVNYGRGATLPNREVTLHGGFIGSTTTFRLQNYEESVNITPQDYGFSGSYNATEQTASHSVGGLNFTTSRLRTGYIENEYITMSPRRAGYGTAYIEYDFERVVEGINVDLTYWSDDERYYSWDGPTAVIEYQSLTDNTWIQKENILNLGLPTNRSQPKTYRLDFPERTRKIRFYTHFKAMSGFTDRNKGRICIGDMTIDTFF